MVNLGRGNLLGSSQEFRHAAIITIVTIADTLVAPNAACEPVTRSVRGFVTTKPSAKVLVVHDKETSANIFGAFEIDVA